MKSKYSVIVFCLSFTLLMAALGSIMAQKGMCQWHGNGLAEDSATQGHIIAGALYSVASTGNVVAGSLLHRSGFSPERFPGQNDLQHAWGIRVADYYFHDFFLDPLIGLGDYLRRLQFGSLGSSVSASGFPIITSFIYPPAYTGAFTYTNTSQALTPGWNTFIYSNQWGQGPWGWGGSPGF